jgi:hypothetical protein
MPRVGAGPDRTARPARTALTWGNELIIVGDPAARPALQLIRAAV